MWLYFRFTLSFRDIEELLAARGIVLTYETIQQWCLKFGQQFAKKIRRRQPRPGVTWFLDEVFITIGGHCHNLWRGVDQDGDVLDILVQKRRDKQAAKRFFRKLLEGLRYAPRRIITDKLRSYGAARKEVPNMRIFISGTSINLSSASCLSQPAAQLRRQEPAPPP